MSDFKVKTAGELADTIENIITAYEPEYIRNTPLAASLPLIYFRINVNPMISTRAHITVSLHAKDTSDNHVGGLEKQFNVVLPDEELDNFLEYYKFTQLDSETKKENRVITYNIPLFRGSYRAFKQK